MRALVAPRRLAAGVVAGALTAALAGCGAPAPAGRLGTDVGASATTLPGTPVEVVNTTTTGPPGRAGTGTGTDASTGSGRSSSGSGSGSALGFPGGTSGGGTGQGQGSGSSGASNGSASEQAQIQAMVACLRSKGVNVPPPRTDPNGNAVYDEATFAALSQDPKAQAAAQACAAQIGTPTN